MALSVSETVDAVSCSPPSYIDMPATFDDPLYVSAIVVTRLSPEVFSDDTAAALDAEAFDRYA